MRNFDFSIKTVFVGDSGVGKTCILNRFTREFYADRTQATLGVEFMSKIVDNPKNPEQKIELQLWDTAGQELFRSVTRGYYRGAEGAFIVFDLTAHITFESVGKWLKDIEDSAHQEVVKILIGNKSDITDERAVTFQEASTYAKEHGMKYFETSAKTGDQVIESIIGCVDEIVGKINEGRFVNRQRNAMVIDSSDKKKGCSC